MLTPRAGKSGSSRLLIVLTTSCSVEFLASNLLAPWRSLTSVHSRSFHSRVPSEFFGFFEPAWLRRDSDRLQYVRHNDSLVPLLKMMLKSSVYQKRSSLGYHLAPKRKLPHKVTRTILPNTGRRVDDLYNRQDRTPEFGLISFLIFQKLL